MPRKRSQPDPLRTVNEVRYLVVKDAHLPTVHQCRRLEPNTDLKDTLAAEREKFVKGGWKVDPVTTRVSFCFAARDAERILINIQALHPDEPTIGHGTFLGGTFPGKRSADM